MAVSTRSMAIKQTRATMLTFDPSFHSNRELGCVLWADETMMKRVRFDIGHRMGRGYSVQMAVGRNGATGGRAAGGRSIARRCGNEKDGASLWELRSL